MFQVPGTPATVTLSIMRSPAGCRPLGSRSQTIRYDWNADAVPSQMSHAALYWPVSEELHLHPVHSSSMVEKAAGRPQLPRAMVSEYRPQYVVGYPIGVPSGIDVPAALATEKEVPL